jgi:hypothetical protein
MSREEGDPVHGRLGWPWLSDGFGDAASIYLRVPIWTGWIQLSAAAVQLESIDRSIPIHGHFTSSSSLCCQSIMAGLVDPKPDSPMPETIRLQGKLPSPENKVRNLSGQVQTNKLDAKYEVFSLPRRVQTGLHS